ncbi:MAG: hypothetical protein AB3X44_06970 [Leptothrix sp. (in: b-proteobacteria)]
MINPWNPLTPPGAASTDQPSQTNWHDAAHLQQRWWSDWLEAGNIWLSWWYSTLPPMPWPPAGTVLPAQQVDGSSQTAGQAPTQHNAAAPAPSPSATPPATARKSRAQSARHH